MVEIASISQQAVSRVTKGAGTGECTYRLSKRQPNDNQKRQKWKERKLNSSEMN